jgi:beta-phosphoglucomutase-like phosphatase (HAD superfamily)
VKPEECIVVEDSRNGVLAGKAAGMHVVATTNVYTEKENLNDADIIVTCLGDAQGEKGTMSRGAITGYNGVLHIDQLTKFFSK